MVFRGWRMLPPSQTLDNLGPGYLWPFLRWREPGVGRCWRPDRLGELLGSPSVVQVLLDRLPDLFDRGEEAEELGLALADRLQLQPFRILEVVEVAVLDVA